MVVPLATLISVLYVITPGRLHREPYLKDTSTEGLECMFTYYKCIVNIE